MFKPLIKGAYYGLNYKRVTICVPQIDGLAYLA